MAAAGDMPLESRVLKDNYRRLIRDCEPQAHSLLDELYSQDLLDADCHTKYTSGDMNPRRALAEALKEVINMIWQKSLLWKNFLQALKNSDLESVADYLEKELKSRTTAISEDSPEAKRNLDQVLTPDDLSEVYQAAYEARHKWFNIGVALKLKVGNLNAIEAGQESVDAKCLNMIQEWLQNGTNPTWRTLAEALGSKIVGMLNLKKEIMD